MKLPSLREQDDWVVNAIVGSGFIAFCIIVLFAVLALAIGPTPIPPSQPERYKLATFTRNESGVQIICTTIEKVEDGSGVAISCLTP